MKDLILFKWETYCRRFHVIGCFFHLFNCFMINYYVYEAYIKPDIEESNKINLALIAGMTYPAIYEIVQMYMIGLDYFNSGWNLIDILNILAMLVNVVLQYTLGPMHIASKMVMLFLVLILITNCFYFLRVFP